MTISNNETTMTMMLMLMLIAKWYYTSSWEKKSIDKERDNIRLPILELKLKKKIRIKQVASRDYNCISLQSRLGLDQWHAVSIASMI